MSTQAYAESRVNSFCLVLKCKLDLCESLSSAVVGKIGVKPNISRKPSRCIKTMYLKKLRVLVAKWLSK